MLYENKKQNYLICLDLLLRRVSVLNYASKDILLLHSQQCINNINYVPAKHIYVSQLASCVIKSFSFRLN